VNSRSGFNFVQWVILGLVVVLVMVILGLVGSILFAAPAQVSLQAQASVTPAVSPASSNPPVHSPQPSPTDVGLIVFPSVVPAGPTGCLMPGAERVDALVKTVVDGVTLLVEAGGKPLTVRYLGVDLVGTGAEAAAYNRGLVEGKTVTLVKDAFDADVNGAVLRYVLVGDQFVNYALIRAGEASTALFPPGASCADTFVEAERQASSERLGFWGSEAQNLPTLPAIGAHALTSTPPCNCDRAYTCSEFDTHASAQACFDACGDYRNVSLDPDHNGLACENLP
jgi:micrococcal nuclease